MWNTGTCRQNLRCRSVRDCESYGNDDEGADAARWKDRKFNAVLRYCLQMQEAVTYRVSARHEDRCTCPYVVSRGDARCELRS